MLYLYKASNKKHNSYELKPEGGKDDIDNLTILARNIKKLKIGKAPEHDRHHNI